MLHERKALVTSAMKKNAADAIKQQNIEKMQVIEEDRRINLRKVEISLIINDKIIQEDLSKDLEINTSFNAVTPQYLSNVLGEDGLLVSRWNLLYNEAAEIFENEEIEYEIWEAGVFETYRQKLIDSGVTKPSDTKVMSLVKQDIEYRGKNARLIRSRRNMKDIGSIAKGFARRGDKAVIIASLVKSELGLLPSLGKKYNQIKPSGWDEDEIMS